jgi:tRNA-2-methylthio-N6-dimethylallyladenosine synthase
MIEMTKRLYVETWGCQMNIHQSEGIVGVLERDGFTLTKSLADADVAIFNTCMVRQKAEEKVYGRIGAVVEEKRKREVLLGVGGCLAQVRGEDLLRRFKAIDFVFGSNDLAALPGIVHDAGDARSKRIAHLVPPVGIDEVPSKRQSSVTAMVTITQGCSNFCSYCVVPYARGPLRSRDPNQILREAEQATRDGYPEILLLGQNVDSYGTDRPQYGSFANLLERIADIGTPRIRFTSSHPKDMTPQVIEQIAAHDNICNHIHLACQSGSDRILREMNRGYTRQGFLSILEGARSVIPDINITTDLIVGYPGETEEDFADSLELIRQARFGSIFVAMYSPRPRTRSALVADDVTPEVKSARLHHVLDLQREIALAQNRRRIGVQLEILIEGKTRNGEAYGRTDDHRTVVIAGKGAVGEFVPVFVEDATAAALVGKRADSMVPQGAQ